MDDIPMCVTCGIREALPNGQCPRCYLHPPATARELLVDAVVLAPLVVVGLGILAVKALARRWRA
jgi:hypothetical protein